MKKIFAACVAATMLSSACTRQFKNIISDIPVVKQDDKVQILVVGSAHFGQTSYYKDLPKADLFSAQRQKEVADINQQLARYKPDMIMIEVTPEEQSSVDSLYHLFQNGKLSLNDLSYGRAEQYQVGYNLARQLGLNRIYGVDYYESVSNRMLVSGDNIKAYQDALALFNKMGGKVDAAYKDGSLSLNKFLRFFNDPAILDYTYRLFYLTPAQVRNAEFVNPPAAYVDTAYVNKKYIGAEFVSVFYERELKIYSNIITTQRAQGGKRLLVVMGQRHAASLSKIFANDPEYRVIPFEKYVK